MFDIMVRAHGPTYSHPFSCVAGNLQGLAKMSVSLLVMLATFVCTSNPNSCVLTYASKTTDILRILGHS